MLLAEDEPALRDVLAEALRDWGFEVVEAADGGQALEILEAQRPFDAIVLDEEMPRLKGRDLLSRLRSGGSTVAAVLCSGSLEMDSEERARLGVAALLRKPFPLEALLEVLRSVVPAARQQR